MIKNITIGDKVVTMKATATISYRYKSCFGKDLFIESKQLSKKEKTKGIPMEFIHEIGYIMAMAGEGNGDKVTREGFFDWLDQFEMVDMMKAANDIANLYLTSRGTSSESKKKNVQ